MARFISLLVLVTAAWCDSASATPQLLYWSDEGTGFIFRADLNGGGIEQIIDADSARLRGIATSDRHLFYVVSGGGALFRSNLDGTGATLLVSGGGSVVEVDRLQGKVYWGAVSLNRANLDGSDPEGLLDISGTLHSLAIDEVGGRMYWTTTSAAAIQSANLDGSNEQVVLSRPAIGVDIDSGGRKLYWAGPDEGMFRANLDGTEVEDLGISKNAWHIALDIARGQIYWGDFSTGELMKANLDGTNTEAVVQSAGRTDIEIGPAVAVPAASAWLLVVLGLGLTAVATCILRPTTRRGNGPNHA